MCSENRYINFGNESFQGAEMLQNTPKNESVDGAERLKPQQPVVPDQK